MGSPVSPIVANLFMEDFEHKALSSFSPAPSFWGRYVDDTITILETSCVSMFTSHLNSVHPAIKFTVEEETECSIPVLDTRITRLPDGHLSFSVYRKGTHTDQYLQFNSHQPLQHKLGVIRTLNHRARTLCSTPEAYTAETEHLKKVLTISGYTQWAWDLPSTRKMKPPTTTRVADSRARKGYTTLPYVQGVTEALSRIIRKQGVSVHTKPMHTIRQTLVHPKDRTSKLDKCGVIYECDSCPSHYVGETERSLRKRAKEHHRDSSPVGHHMKIKGHSFEEGNIKVLDKESDWFKRGVKEAAYISITKPQLNRDRGRHQSLLQSCDLGATPRSHLTGSHQ